MYFHAYNLPLPWSRIYFLLFINFLTHLINILLSMKECILCLYFCVSASDHSFSTASVIYLFLLNCFILFSTKIICYFVYWFSDIYTLIRVSKSLTLFSVGLGKMLHYMTLIFQFVKWKFTLCWFLICTAFLSLANISYKCFMCWYHILATATSTVNETL